MTPVAQRHSAVAIAALLLLTGLAALFYVLTLPQGNLLERVQQRGELVVATRRSPSTYFQGPDGPDGFEYRLVRQFARQLGVEARFEFPASLQALVDETRYGEVNMAAAGLTVTPRRQTFLDFSTPYDTVGEQLVYRLGDRRPRSLDEIAPGDLHVVAGSSHEETLERLRADGHPDLQWVAHDEAETDGLLAALETGEIRLTVLDSREAALKRRLYQRVAVAMELGDPVPVAWAFAAGSDDSLRAAADRFIAEIQQDGRLQRLLARYFGHAGRLNYVDTRAFWRAVHDRLPQYRALFEQAGEQTGIDWRLLAAIGYQESHWRADAVSPTGVRGIMMLTQAAARQIGVSDRNDPAQSIVGGARYLRVVEKKIPERIQPPNRLWLTLAGYNIGFGHLEDARILTERDGANPDLWLEVKQRLPLLADKRYHSTLKHGFARGQEPVDYVDNIRNYYDMLVWFTTTEDKRAVKLLLAETEAKSDASDPPTKRNIE